MPCVKNWQGHNAELTRRSTAIEGVENVKQLSCHLVLIAWASLLIAGCSEVVTTPQTVMVVEVFEEHTPLGCIGTNWNTVVRSDDNRVHRMCGKLGKPGDKIAGCWITGHWDYVRNGFKLDC
jgi:hypothetical protein